MKIAEWLTMTYEETKYKGFVREHLVCIDGFRISVQASGWHYCSPRMSLENGEEYTTLELGFANMKDELIEEYRSGPIYPYVPVDVVDKLIEKHGGIEL